jgi:hypothetical protein
MEPPETPMDPFGRVVEAAFVEFGDELQREAARLHRAALEREVPSADAGGFACLELRAAETRR